MHFFLLVFVVAPLVVLIYYAFTNGQGEITLSNLTGFFSNPNTLGTLCYSFAIAMVTTVVCLLSGLSHCLYTGNEQAESEECAGHDLYHADVD